MIQPSPLEHCDSVERPQITIVTVCLNDLTGLRATYDSLLMQSVAPHQWIVADGLSEDGTREWLTSTNWHPLTWMSERDGGIFDAMNKGFRKSDAEYVLFLNSGDVLAAPDVLEVVGNALAACDDRPSLLYGDSFEVEANGVNYLRRARPACWVPIGMPTTHQAMYFRADALGAGFDTRYHLSGDYAAVSTLYAQQHGRDFLYLPVPLCRFKLGGRSEQLRGLLNREHHDIRRRLLQMGSLQARVLHLLHTLHGLVKTHVPILHRRARYG